MICNIDYVEEFFLTKDIKYFVIPVSTASEAINSGVATADDDRERYLSGLTVVGTGEINQEIFISYSMLNNNKINIINNNVEYLIENKIGSCICNTDGSFTYENKELGYYKDIETDGIGMRFTTFSAYVIWCYRSGV